MSIPNSSKRPPLITTISGAPATSSEPADILVVFGKGVHPDDIKQIRPLLQNLDVSSLLFGDGVRNVRSKPLQLAMRDKVKKDGQVVIISHGSNKPHQHAFELADFSKGYGHIPTINLIGWSRNLQASVDEDAVLSKKQRTGKQFVHLIACHAGQVVDQIMPGSVGWKSGYTLIYSNKNETSIHETASSLEAALSYFDWCKVKDTQVDPLKLFLLASKRQGQSLTLLGGKLKAPLVSRAPTTLAELDEQQARSRITGNVADLRRLDAAELALTPAEIALLPHPKQHLLDILFQCIERGDSIAFSALLNAHPELINGRDLDGLNCLITACDEGQIDCVKILIRLGADLDMNDDSGTTALHTAVTKRDTELVSLLLQAGAWTNIRNGNRQTPLEQAQALGALDIATLISDHRRKL